MNPIPHSLRAGTAAVLAAGSLAVSAGCSRTPTESAAAPASTATPVAAPAVAATGAPATTPPDAQANARPGGGGPPVAVTTVRARRQDMPVTVDVTGTVTAVAAVDVKPQASSVVTRVHVTEGQFVRAGDPLFTLDARADEANVAKLRAQQARDEAALADLQRQLARNQELRARNFIAQAAVDTTQAQVDAQVAAVGADRAAVDAARVALSYARIFAPVSGRIGVVGVWPGGAVIANQTTLLGITQIDPIDVAFALPQRHLADALAMLAGVRDGRHAPVSATLPDGQGTLTGRLVFVDNAVDAASGTVRVKARFANPRSALWPGAFVRVAMTIGAVEDAVIVPQASVIRSARGPQVYVVAEGRAQLRQVEVLAARGDDAAVRGVREGEAVVLDGRQNLRPGASVSVGRSPR